MDQAALQPHIFKLSGDGRLLLADPVPVWVCRACGSEHFDETQTRCRRCRGDRPPSGLSLPGLSACAEQPSGGTRTSCNEAPGFSGLAPAKNQAQLLHSGGGARAAAG